MIGLKVLSTAAALALVLAMAPAASFAQNHVARGGGARAAGGHVGGAGFRGGAPGARFGGGGYGYRGGGGVGAGLIAGAVIGGALASGAYYGGPGYYPPGYYDQYDNGPVAVVGDPGGGDETIAYCMQTYRSYDPRSGTYVGYDGQRHPCP